VEQLQQADSEDCSLKMVNHPEAGSAATAFDGSACKLFGNEKDHTFKCSIIYHLKEGETWQLTEEPYLLELLEFWLVRTSLSVSQLFLIDAV